MLKVDVKIDFSGLEIQKVIESVSEEMFRGAVEIQNIARTLVPVRTGSLRRSIQAMSLEQMRDALSVDVRANMPYAVFVEYGTVKMEPRPYLNPAKEEVVPKMIERIRQKLAGG